MKKEIYSSLALILLVFISLFYPAHVITGQEVTKESPALPEEINKIVTASCTPCHTSTGGMLSRGKLNFTEWTKYSAETQKKKAEKMYSELKKGAMPPKSARETNPDIIPTKDQVDIIKKWSESF
jgi:cytochrome c5